MECRSRDDLIRVPDSGISKSGKFAPREINPLYGKSINHTGLYVYMDITIAIAIYNTFDTGSLTTVHLNSGHSSVHMSASILFFIFNRAML